MKKIPGRKIVEELKIPNFIKQIYVFGNLNVHSKKYLYELYHRKILHITLPVDNVDNLHKNFCNIQFLDTDLIFLTLPTPKQEQFAELIMKNNKFYKIICIGGAINMASGLEKPVPTLMERLNLEFIWRLRTDTIRRLKRLIVSAAFYFLGEISFKFKNLNKKILNDK
jgi:exopolysaccharide biosynthesis WecB/TagA/CpsF family protein